MQFTTRITPQYAAAIGCTLPDAIVIDSKKKLIEAKLKLVVDIAAQYLSDPASNEAVIGIDRLRLKGTNIKNGSNQPLRNQTILEQVVLDRFTSLLHKEKKEEAAALWNAAAAEIKIEFSKKFVIYVTNLLTKLQEESKRYPPDCDKIITNIFDNIIRDIEFYKEKCGFDIKYNYNGAEILIAALVQQQQKYDFIYLIKKLISIGSILKPKELFEWLGKFVLSDNDMLSVLLPLHEHLADDQKISLLEIALARNNFKAFEKILNCGLKNYRNENAESIVYKAAKIIGTNAEGKNEPIYFNACVKEWKIELNINLIARLINTNSCSNSCTELFIDSGINFLESYDENRPPLLFIAHKDIFLPILSRYTPIEACQAFMKKNVLNSVEVSDYKSAYLDYCFSEIDSQMSHKMLFFVLEHAQKAMFRLDFIKRSNASGFDLLQSDQEGRFAILLAKNAEEVALILSLFTTEMIIQLFADKQFFMQWHAISKSCKWEYIFHMLENNYELKIEKTSLLPENPNQSIFLSTEDPKRLSLLFAYYPLNLLRELFLSDSFQQRWFKLPLPATFHILRLEEMQKYNIQIHQTIAERILAEDRNLTPSHIEFLLSCGANPLNESGECALFAIKQPAIFSFLCDRYLSKIKQVLVDEPPECLQNMAVYKQCKYFEIAFSEKPFTYAKWLLPIISRKGITKQQLADWYTCIYSKEIFSYLACKSAVFRQSIPNMNGSGPSEKWESLQLLEKLLFIQFSPPGYFNDCPFTEEFFNKKIIDKAFDTAPRSLSELITQHKMANRIATDQIQYLMALYFLPPEEAACFAPAKQLTYFCMASEENAVLFLQILQGNLLTEKYLSWKGELFDKKIEELDNPLHTKEQKQALWNHWLKESRNLNFSLCQALNLEKFIPVSNEKTLVVIQMLLGELKEIETNLNVYRKKIALLDSELAATDAIPQEYLCPLTRRLIKNPVFDGERYYEKEAIYTWLQKADEDPLTRKNLTIDQLQDAPQMREAIVLWSVNRIGTLNDSLFALREKLKVCNIISDPDHHNSFKDEYEKLFEQKMALLHQLDSIKATEMNTILPAALRLYCCTSKDAIHSIITEGIRLDVSSHFGEGEFGAGLYLSTKGPDYLSHEFPCVIILEVREPIEGCVIEPLTMLKRHVGEQVTKEYLEIKELYPVLQHAGQPPAESEIILHHPRGKIGIVGIVKEHQSLANFTPIDTYCEKNKLKLHSQWKERLDVDLRHRDKEELISFSSSSSSSVNLSSREEELISVSKGKRKSLKNRFFGRFFKRSQKI